MQASVDNNLNVFSFRFAIILLPPAYDKCQSFHSLLAELNQFETNVTTIGGVGLEISE